MNAASFKKLLEDRIAPMFSGCTVEDADPAKNASDLRATLENLQHIKVRWSPQEKFQFYLKRSQEFAQPDAKFVDAVIRNVGEFSQIESTPYFEELIDAAIRRAVAAQTGKKATDLTNHILRQFELWSEETYEGRPISAVIGIVTNAEVPGGIGLKTLLGMSIGKVATNSFDSIATVSGNGGFMGYENVPACPALNKVRAPQRFAALANWAKDGKICLALTRNGEILIFRDGELGFARRRGSWRNFNHDALITRIGSHNAFSSDLSTAVYLSCLDVSFAKVGGGIGLVRATKLTKLRKDKRVDPADCCDGPSDKAKFLTKAVNMRKFQEMARPLRQMILGIDGSTVLQRDGTVVAVGAIIKVKAGSKTGGGRKAASMALGEYGLGIKISSDGEIAGFNQSGEAQEPLFTFG